MSGLCGRTGIEYSPQDTCDIRHDCIVVSAHHPGSESNDIEKGNLDERPTKRNAKEQHVGSYVWTTYRVQMDVFFS